MRKFIFTVGGVVVSLLAAVQADAQHLLDGTFIKYDKNKDGFLDAGELAKAFRGPNAKPVIEKPGAKERHPDHRFLDVWDGDRDGNISRAEFERYEQKAIADARAVANQNRIYTRTARPSYRTPYRHPGRGRGVNPLRLQQRVYQMQRQAYVYRRQHGVYSPKLRGGYRAAMRHHQGRR